MMECMIPDKFKSTCLQFQEVYVNQGEYVRMLLVDSFMLITCVRIFRKCYLKIQLCCIVYAYITLNFNFVDK